MKTNELADAVREWLAVDDHVAEHGWDSVLPDGRHADDAWDELKNRMADLVNENKENEK